MLTSKRQYNAAKLAAEDLRSAILTQSNYAEKSSALARMAANKDKRKLREIEKQIEEYERVTSNALEEIELLTFEDFLKAPIIYRLSNHMTISRFSELTGINSRQITRYENEEYENCSTSTLREIFNKINLNISAHLKARL